MKSIDLAAIDLNLLVAFEALYEERSVTLAAQRLYLGQPAVSAALARLRSLFQDELLIRTGRETTIISSSDLVASIPSRLAAQFVCLGQLELFELPVQTPPWTVSLLWSKLTDSDRANLWLRQLIQSVCKPDS